MVLILITHQVALIPVIFFIFPLLLAIKTLICRFIWREDCSSKKQSRYGG